MYIVYSYNGGYGTDDGSGIAMIMDMTILNMMDMTMMVDITVMRMTDG